jgi:DNA (cytosine-5)-methyltransferase 1
VDGYVAEDDPRHYLYREYIRILERLKPAAFVMENVKGMLSSRLEGERIFEKVKVDLKAAAGPDSYQLFCLSSSEVGGVLLSRAHKDNDFLIHSEDFGVPQTRHRVIIVGIRSDLAPSPGALVAGGAGMPSASVEDVLSGMPALRCRLSQKDSPDEWHAAVLRQMDVAIAAVEKHDTAPEGVLGALKSGKEEFEKRNTRPLTRSAEAGALPGDCPTELKAWLKDPELTATLNHASRAHMEADLARYYFCSVFRDAAGRVAKAPDFPADLAPKHSNWESGAFKDRFRAQGWDEPSNTITSHIHKDGHYFIHPDPQQCRSLTVREAARLQTFPDNYLFLGNTTEQYIQVGNAVPPFLARQIAAALHRTLISEATSDQQTR